MTPALSERARELGEWLRRRERLCFDEAVTLAESGETEDSSTWRECSEEYKSRAETLESLLAENERLRAERALIEREVAERCAEIAEDHAGDVSSGAVNRIAAAIRSAFPAPEE